MAEQLDKPVDDVSRMLRLNERITSVDTPLGGFGKALLDIWPTRRNNGPEDTTARRRYWKQSIVKWLFGTERQTA
ncbi:hypothetical protein M8494_22915 [Serratia ureilytica]